MSTVFDSYSPSLPQYKAITPPKKKSLKRDPVSENINVVVTKTRSLGKVSKQGLVSKCPSVDTRCNRTVFVGNIPAICTKKHIKQLFKPHGSVQCVRFRSTKVVPDDASTGPAKKRADKKLVEGSSFNAYIVMSSPSEAEGSLCLNGTLFHGRHLRVDVVAGANEESAKNTLRSVFVGNLPFSADEEKLREVFSICGEIEDVRIVRDRKSGIGKGFGFVMFTDSSGAMFAVKQHKKATLDGRSLRVCRSKDQQSLQEEKQVKLSGIRCQSVKVKRSADGMNKNKQDKIIKRQHRSKNEKMPRHKNNSKLKQVSKQALTSKGGKRNPDGTKNRHRRRV